MASSSSSKTANEPSVDDLSKQIETLKADLSELTSLVGEVGKAKADEAVNAAKAKGREAKALTEDQLQELRVFAERYHEDALTYTRDKPAMALGMAAGLGLLVGMIMSGRR